MSQGSCLLATENPNKSREMKELLSSVFSLVSLDDLKLKLSLPEEGVESYEQNAAQKAIYVGSETGVLSLGDDSGFEVSAMKGEPGVLSARFAQTKDPSVQRAKILEQVQGSSDRSCKFVCVLALYDPVSKKLWSYRGEVRGRLATESRGDFGFGYDPIFIPEGYDQTFGELSSDIKNQISHRACAINELKKQWQVSL